MISANERLFGGPESETGVLGAGRLTSGRESGALFPFELVPPILDCVDVILDDTGAVGFVVARGCAVPV